MADEDAVPRFRVRSREDEEVEWPEHAVKRAKFLERMFDDASGDSCTEPLPVPTAALRMIAAMCESDEPYPLAGVALEELTSAMQAAHYLEAEDAFKSLASDLFTRMDGMGMGELRAMLGAADDLSEEEVATSLAEPPFEPESLGEPPLQHSLSNGGTYNLLLNTTTKAAKAWVAACLTMLSYVTTAVISATSAMRYVHSLCEPEACAVFGPTGSDSIQLGPDDAIEAALKHAASATLRQLKGVDKRWRGRARFELCARLCGVQGQPTPTRREDVTDLDVERLQRGEVTAAGQAGRLPNLSRLHGYGFSVDVAAVRQAELSQEEAREVGAALLECILPSDGEVPLELFVAAVACAGSGMVWGIPVQQLREDALTSLDLANRHIEPAGVQLLAELVAGTSSLVELNLRNNELRTEGWCAIFSALRDNKDNKIESWDLSQQNINPEIAKVLAEYVSASTAITFLNLDNNSLTNYGRDMSGVIKLAEALKENNSLQTLSLRGDSLGLEGWCAIFKALRDNKDNKIKSWDLSREGINAEIAKVLAEYVLVSTAITSLKYAASVLAFAASVSSR